MMPGAEYRYHIVSRPIRSRPIRISLENRSRWPQIKCMATSNVASLSQVHGPRRARRFELGATVSYRCLRVRVVLSVKVLIGSTKQTGPDRASMRISAATIIYLTDADDTVTTWGPTDGSEFSRQS